MVTNTEGRVYVFRLYLPHAGSVELVGSFAGWPESSRTMERDAEGFWCAELEVEPGEHWFSYLVDGVFWMPDYAASGVERNECGNWVSKLDVPSSGEPVVGAGRPLPGREAGTASGSGRRAPEVRVVSRLGLVPAAGRSEL